jgi:transposase
MGERGTGMAFCKHPLVGIPDETRSVAEKVCVGSTAWYLKLSRELRRLYSQINFEPLYPDAGQWGIHPFRVFALLMLQVLEGLSDRAAADQIRTNIGWKYILGLTLDHEGWDASVFAKARDRLMETDAQTLVLDEQLKVLREKGLLKTKKQRIDATPIDAYVKVLNRTELVLEAVRNAIEALSEQDPEWLMSIARSDWRSRYYFDRPFNYRLPKSDKAKVDLAQQAGDDGFHILDCIGKAPEPKRSELASLEEITVMRRVLEDQFHPPDDRNGPKLRDPKELKPSGERIVSPYETEARTASKGEKTWTGYKFHSTETCVKDSPNFITDARIEPATKNDSLTLPDVVDRLSAKELLPEKLYADGGYVNVPFFTRARLELGLDIVSRLVNGHSWQSKENGLDQTQFRIDFSKQEAVCPANVSSSLWKAKKDGHIEVFFPREACSTCALKTQCTRTEQRILRIQSEPVFRQQQFMRQRQRTAEFRQEYAVRAGAEGTQSEFVRVAGRQSSVRGQTKTNFKYVCAAVAVNFARLFRWELRRKPRLTPTGKFLALAVVA